MSNKIRKRWSFEEKLEILSVYQKEGVGRTSRQFGVSTTMIYKWQRTFEEEGEAGPCYILLYFLKNHTFKMSAVIM